MNETHTKTTDHMKTYSIKKIVMHHDGLKSFYFDIPFTILPGQFVNVWLPGVDEKPFSISNIADDQMEITIKAVGPFTKALMDCKEGDPLGIRGPFGNGFTLRENTLIIGGGIGIAPVRYLAKALEKVNKRPIQLLGTKNKQDMIFLDEIGGELTTLYTEDGLLGEQGLVTEKLQRSIDHNNIDLICACGPEPLLLAVKEIAEKNNIHYQLAFERYMKCGIGICGSCCMDGTGLRVCQEGPVLSQEELEGVTELGQPHRDASGQRKIRKSG